VAGSLERNSGWANIWLSAWIDRSCSRRGWSRFW
jgi:hypothetical protein